MARTVFKAALIVGAILGAAAFGATVAVAQFGTIFGDPPPRPPGGVPGGRQPLPPQDYNYPPPSQSFPSSPSRQAPPQGPYGGVQSQPLPPPPGANTPPPQRAPAAAQPPAQRSPRTQPAAVTPPADEVIAEPSANKITNPQAAFTGLDKITGRIINFDVAIGETVQFGALQLTTRACFTRPPTETTVTDAFVEVDEVTLQGEVKRIFTGWVFAESPGLSAIEHPIYDLWLNDCKGGAQTAAAEAPAADAAPAGRPQPKQQQQQQQKQKAAPRQPVQPVPPPQGYPPFR
jgi:hypothetical protein